MVDDDDDEIVDAVVKVAAKVLCCTEDEVRSNRLAYQATCSSDLFDSLYLPEIDWRTLVLPASRAAAAAAAAVRNDFDLSRSSVFLEELLERAELDDDLKRIVTRQQATLYGTQIRVLVEEARLDPTWLHRGQFKGAIRSRTSGLIDTLRAMLLLDDPNGNGGELRIPSKHSEVAEEHAELIASVGRPNSVALRAHIGLFFQTPNAARCSGAFFMDSEMREMTVRRLAEDLGEPAPSLPPPDPNYASWIVGEGQGHYSLSLRDDEVADGLR